MTTAPYLAPVPESEPPFDDELDHPGWRAVHGPRPVGFLQQAGPPQLRTSSGRRTPPDPPPGPAIEPPTEAVVEPTTGPAIEPPTGAVVEPPTGPTILSPPKAGLPRARPITIKAAGIPSWSSESDIGVVRTASANLPPVRRSASVLARAVIEVLAGHRPVAQLRVHCSPAVYAGLGERPAVVSRSLPHLLNVRVCEPADGVAEVSAVFRRADRVRALAFRLQGVDGRWRITALQVG